MKTITTRDKDKCRKPSITFFFPYYDISGVPVLFLRMAEYLSRFYGFNTCVIDYENGYMARTIREHNSTVQVRFFEDGVSMNIGPETILVLQSILPYTMRQELKISRETRIIFWTLYHLNLIQTIIPSPFFRDIQARYIIFHKIFMNTLMLSLKKRLQQLVLAMNNKRSLFFMDGSTLQFTQDYLEVDIDNPVFMPVPCDDVAENMKMLRLQNNKDHLSFAWVGRIADFKTHILIYTMRRLSQFAYQKKINIKFHIIGEGGDEAIIRALNINHDHFEIIYDGVIAGKHLDQFLLDFIDVLAAMGTSALEGAKLGVPTILLDASYGPITGDYKFKWLFESKDFVLGDHISELNYAPRNGSLERIMDEVLNNYRQLSARTFDYCAQKHSLETVCKKFITAIGAASFCYGDFSSEIKKKSWIRNSYEYIRKIKGGV